jgi:hypothetical protein
MECQFQVPILFIDISSMETNIRLKEGKLIVDLLKVKISKDLVIGFCNDYFVCLEIPLIFKMDCGVPDMLNEGFIHLNFWPPD